MVTMHRRGWHAIVAVWLWTLIVSAQGAYYHQMSVSSQTVDTLTGSNSFTVNVHIDVTSPKAADFKIYDVYSLNEPQMTPVRGWSFTYTQNSTNAMLWTLTVNGHGNHLMPDTDNYYTFRTTTLPGYLIVTGSTRNEVNFIGDAAWQAGDSGLLYLPFNAIVPEPSTIALGLLALAGVWICRKKRLKS